MTEQPEDEVSARHSGARGPWLIGGLCGVIAVMLLLFIAGGALLLLWITVADSEDQGIRTSEGIRRSIERDSLVDSDRRGSEWCAAWLGDVDRDGRDDLLLSTPSEPCGAESWGVVRVLSGHDGTTLSSVPQYHAVGGESVRPAGDVDGDGSLDLFVHDRYPDRTRVVSWDFRTEIHVLEDSWEFGARAAGDLDGDGRGEILIAESQADCGGDSRGRVRVLSGADGSLLREHVGERDDEHFGTDCCDLGDVNADGVRDYAISTGSNLYEFNEDSLALVYSGRDGRILRRITGLRDGGYQNWLRLAPTGDVDRDGVNDLLVGGVSHDSSDVWDGIALALVSGQERTILWRRLVEETSYDFCDVGDLDGDGCSDLCFGRDDSWTIESGCTGEVLATAEGYSFGSGVGDADGDGHADLLRLTNRWGPEDEPPATDLWRDGMLEIVSGKDGGVLVRVDAAFLDRAR